ncbi:hypothetical protein KAR91_36335 [Candidatus Pacearchaeota archaeon]|nr:hypothetical protein [Candidatus Pacearchaeota archaeon]
MAKLKLNKSPLKPYHFFYVGFFVLYLVALYYFLYLGTGLGALQINGHFFSNVIGSLSKRFLSEASVYGFIFYLLYYTKTHWRRIALVTFFVVTFLINTLSIGYYFIHRVNWQPGSLDVPLSLVLFAFFSVVVTIEIAVLLMKFKNSSKQVWILKRNLFGASLLLLAVLTPLIPVAYSTHRSVVDTQENVEKTFRTFHLEKSGTTHLYEVLTGKYQPTIVPDVSVFDFKEEAGE